MGALLYVEMVSELELRNEMMAILQQLLMDVQQHAQLTLGMLALLELQQAEIYALSVFLELLQMPQRKIELLNEEMASSIQQSNEKTLI